MKLAEVFAAFGSLVEGSAARGEVAEALYAEDPEGLDARRLAIYVGNVEHSRRRVLELYYPRVRAAVVGMGGDAAWRELVRAYFEKHPSGGYRFIDCAEALPEFLATSDAMKHLPPWMRELADVELWHALIRVDPRDDRKHREEEPLRLATVIELRDYQYAVVSWLRALAGEPEGEPALQANWVLFWRDATQASRRAVVGPLEVAVLAAVQGGQPLASIAPYSREQVANAVQALTSVGVLVGA